MKVFRPADGKETAAAWVSALRGNEPTALVLTRQTLPQYENSGRSALWGGYILDNCEGTPDVLLMASGSEVELCVKAKAVLEEKGVKARVISMPCMEEFNKQTQAYKDRVMPKNVKARVCVEAGSSYSWYKYAGEYGEIIGMDQFGASAPAGVLFPHFGFSVENVVEKALQSLKNVKANEPEIVIATEIPVLEAEEVTE
jgi:transketolase